MWPYEHLKLPIVNYFLSEGGFHCREWNKMSGLKSKKETRLNCNMQPLAREFYDDFHP
jgi:hypothetical protein